MCTLTSYTARGHSQGLDDKLKAGRTGRMVQVRKHVVCRHYGRSPVVAFVVAELRVTAMGNHTQQAHGSASGNFPVS